MKGLTFIPEFAVAVHAGRKTITRRVLNPQPKHRPICADDGKWYDDTDRIAPGGPIRCDYVPGARRCLLTTWAVHRDLDGTKPKRIILGQINNFYFWHAGLGTPKPEWCGKSRPGRFLPNFLRPLMPVLVIESVRVERVQDISEAEALAEGAHCKIWITSTFSAGAMGARSERGTRREGFKEIWESVNGAGSWAANPWCFVIGFKRV